jgi:hypothetical protein
MLSRGILPHFITIISKKTVKLFGVDRFGERMVKWLIGVHIMEGQLSDSK